MWSYHFSLHIPPCAIMDPSDAEPSRVSAITGRSTIRVSSSYRTHYPGLVPPGVPEYSVSVAVLPTLPLGVRHHAYAGVPVTGDRLTNHADTPNQTNCTGEKLSRHLIWGSDVFPQNPATQKIPQPVKVKYTYQQSVQGNRGQSIDTFLARESASYRTHSAEGHARNGHGLALVPERKVSKIT